MINKNPFTKILIKNQKQEFFHSSAYGMAQSGNVIGASSTESFAKRQEIDQNRQNIRKYNDSRVASQRYNRNLHPKQFDPKAIAEAQTQGGDSGTDAPENAAMRRAENAAKSAQNTPIKTPSSPQGGPVNGASRPPASPRANPSFGPRRYP